MLAPRLAPVTVADVPVMTVALAKLSLRGSRNPWLDALIPLVPAMFLALTQYQ